MHAARIRDLYRYTEWANERIVACLRPLPMEALTRDLGGSFSTLRRTLAHMVVAEWIWLERWLGSQPAATPGWQPDAELATLESQLLAVEERRRPWLAGLDDAALARSQRITFRDGSSDTFVLADMLLHVANHATFHRGQLVGMLRQVGATDLPATDFTAFRRLEPRSGAEAGAGAARQPGAPAVRFVVRLAVNAGCLGEFEALACEMAERTRQEPGALEYRFCLDADRTRCRLLEAYADGAAVVAHFQGPVVRELVPRMMQVASLEGFEVFGDPGPQAAALLAGFGAQVYAPGPGFAR
jgi:uncharacterized damage-inducible protein DinB/quinol monooxygenase YgiN